MATTEKRTLSIEARLVDFITKPLGSATQAIGRFAANTITHLRQSVGHFLDLKGAVVGLAGAYLGLHGLHTIEHIAEDAASLQRLARATGDTTENLSELRGALKLNAIDAGQFEAALRALVKMQSEAAGGNRQALDSFRQLGITLQDLQTLGPSQLFERIAGGLEKFGTQQQRTLALAKDLPKALQPLLPVLTQGIDRFQALVREARAVGATVTDEEATRSEELEAAFTKLHLSLESVSRAMIVAFGPDVSAALDKVAKLIGENREAIAGLAKSIGEGIEAAVEVAVRALIGLVSTLEHIPVLGDKLLGIDRPKLRLELKAVEQQLQRIRGLALDPTDIQTTDQSLIGLTEQQLRARQEDLQRLLSRSAAGAMHEAFDQFREEIAHIRASVSAGGEHTALSPDETAKAFGLPTIDDWSQYAKAMDQAMQQTAKSRESVFQTPTQQGFRIPPDDEQIIGHERQRLAIMQQLAALAPDLEAVQRAQDEIGRRSLVLSLQEAKDQGVINAEELARALEQVEEHFRKLHQLMPRGEFSQGFAQGARDAAQAWLDFGAAGREAAQSIIDGGLNQLTDALTAVVLHTKTLGEAFQALGQVVEAELARIIVKLLIMKALEAATGFFGGAEAPMIPGLDGPVLEKGGIVGGALRAMLPLRKFADGGIARGPTVALFGEGRASRGEAFVPLPDGRRIPVALSGAAGGGTVHITIHAMDSADVARAFWDQRGTLRAIFTHDAQRYLSVRQTIQGAAA